MASFMYYLPKADGLNQKVIDSFGLGKALDLSASFTPHYDLFGSDGVVVGYTSDDYPCRYDKERQIWQKALVGDYWLGYWNDAKPTPDDLLRSVLCDSYFIELADGNRWRVPIARLFPEGTALPRALFIGQDGGLMEEVLPEYIEFSKRAEKFWEEMGDLKPEDITAEKKREYFELAADALQVNYRLGRSEVSMLRLITSQNLWYVLYAMIDVPKMNLLMAGDKKKDSEGGLDLNSGEGV